MVQLTSNNALALLAFTNIFSSSNHRKTCQTINLVKVKLGTREYMHGMLIISQHSLVLKFLIITQEPEFSQTCGFCRKLKYLQNFYIQTKLVRINGLDICQNSKMSPLSHLLDFLNLPDSSIPFVQKSDFVTFLTL